MRRARSRAAREALSVLPPGMRIADLVNEALASVSRNPGRSILTALGTVLGAAAFVSTLGLTSTMQRQVSESFDIRRATEVVVRPDRPDLDPTWQTEERLQRFRSLNGVKAAGRRLHLGEQEVTRAVGVSGWRAPVIGADAQALTVMSPHLVVGRTYDQFHEKNAIRVALLAEPVARRINVARVGVAVFIAGEPYTVIGIFDDITRRPEALLSVMIPASAAERITEAGQPAPDSDVIVQTAPGAAQLIGRQAPLALLPESPASLRVTAPPDPRTLRREIETGLTRASLFVSALALLIGTVSIGNAAMAAVGQRTAEIGLRRSVGARPVHIFAQLLAETTGLGGLGGIMGASLGISLTAGAALWNRWQPVLDIRVAAVAAAAGAAAGLLAGLWPAARAMRIPPVTALQR